MAEELKMKIFTYLCGECGNLFAVYDEPVSCGECSRGLPSSVIFVRATVVEFTVEKGALLNGSN